MGMGADHEAGAAVAEKADALLLAGRLAMEVDDDGVGGLPKRASFELLVDDGKGIVERRHEDAADRIDDQHTPAVFGVDQRAAAAGRASRKIRRADEFWRALDEHQRFALVPGVIAERDGIAAGVEQFLINHLGDPETAGRILAVDNDEIERPVADHAGQMLRDGGPPCPADNVAHEKNAQI